MEKTINQGQTPAPDAQEEAYLRNMLEREKSSRLHFFTLTIGMLVVFVLVLYVIVRGHCFVDLPLFGILAAVAVWLMRDLFVKTQRLCDRISEELGEKR